MTMHFNSRIDPGAFHRMPNLKTLILDYNEWDFINTSLTPRLFNHSRLTTLSLSSAFATRSNESYTAEVKGCQTSVSLSSSSASHCISLHVSPIKCVIQCLTDDRTSLTKTTINHSFNHCSLVDFPRFSWLCSWLWPLLFAIAVAVCHCLCRCRLPLPLPFAIAVAVAVCHCSSWFCAEPRVYLSYKGFVYIL